MNDQELIDANEGARLTGLRAQTLYRLARQGRLTRFHVLRRSIRFDRSEVLALVRDRVTQESAR
jgi:excisionase family DNA binding protein